VTTMKPAISGLLILGFIFVFWKFDVLTALINPWSFSTECNTSGDRCKYIIDVPGETKTIRLDGDQRFCMRRISETVPMAFQMLDSHRGAWTSPVDIPPGLATDIKLPITGRKYWKFSSPGMEQNDEPLVLYTRIVNPGTKCVVDWSG